MRRLAVILCLFLAPRLCLGITYYCSATDGNNTTGDGRQSWAPTATSGYTLVDGPPRLLQKTGGFAGETLIANVDTVFLTGSGATTGLYTVLSQDSDDQITLSTAPIEGAGATAGSVTMSAGPERDFAHALSDNAASGTIKLKPGNYDYGANRIYFVESGFTMVVERLGSSGEVIISNSSSYMMDFSQVGGSATFNDITFMSSAGDADISGVLIVQAANTSDLTFNRCTIDGRHGLDGKFGCDYGVVNSVALAAATRDITFNACTIWDPDRGPNLIDFDAITFTGCTIVTTTYSAADNGGGANDNGNAVGITATNGCGAVTFTNNSMTHGFDGLKLAAAASKEVGVCTITGNTFYGSQLGNGVSIQWSGTTGDCDLINVYGNTWNMIGKQAVYIAYNVDRVIVDHNTFASTKSDAGTSAIVLGTEPSTSESAYPLTYGARVTRNRINITGTHADNHMIALLSGATNAEVSYNTVTGANGWGLVVKGKNSIFHHNVIECPYALTIAGGGSSNIIVNNTFIAPDGYAAMRWVSDHDPLVPSDNTVTDCIFVGLGASATPPLLNDADPAHMNMRMDRNIYWKGSRTNIGGLNGSTQATVAALRSAWSSYSGFPWPLNDTNSDDRNPLVIPSRTYRTMLSSPARRDTTWLNNCIGAWQRGEMTGNPPFWNMAKPREKN